MLAKVGIVSVGLGNVASIHRILELLGTSVVHVSSPKECMAVDGLILPGVGHFDQGIRALRTVGLVDALHVCACERKIPILGICLGMQLLCRSSEEGSETGLGLIEADVKKFKFRGKQRLKIPHIGWNIVRPNTINSLIPQIEEELRFYFVHSYYVVPNDSNIVIASANYGGDFCAAFQNGNIFGVQFHPEKSHRFGIALMKNFVEI